MRKAWKLAFWPVLLRWNTKLRRVLSSPPVITAVALMWLGSLQQLHALYLPAHGAAHAETAPTALLRCCLQRYVENQLCWPENAVTKTLHSLQARRECKTNSTMHLLGACVPSWVHWPKDIVDTGNGQAYIIPRMYCSRGD